MGATIRAAPRLKRGKRGFSPQPRFGPQAPILGKSILGQRFMITVSPRASARAGGRAAEAGNTAPVRAISPEHASAMRRMLTAVVASGTVLASMVIFTLLYAALGVPCLPVALNTGLHWPRRRLVRRPGTAVIEFLAPIAPGLDRAPFLEVVQGRIESASDALLAAGRNELAAAGHAIPNAVPASPAKARRNGSPVA